MTTEKDDSWLLLSILLNDQVGSRIDDENVIMSEVQFNSDEYLNITM